MTGARGLFARLFGGGNVSSDSVAAIGADCPDAFGLLELHRRWFLGGLEAAEAEPAAGQEEVEAAEREDLSQEHGR